MIIAVSYFSSPCQSMLSLRFGIKGNETISS